jgi:hypothetical protein
MNRGDFGPVYLPRTLKVVSGKYQVVNGYAAPGGLAGFALGTFSVATGTPFNIAIPQDVLDQLKNEGLVTPTRIDLYNDALNPFSSPANMPRYLSLLQRLASADVNDGA